MPCPVARRLACKLQQFVRNVQIGRHRLGLDVSHVRSNKATLIARFRGRPCQSEVAAAGIALMSHAA